jgi:3-oxoadipate enol-lactonase
MRLAEKWHASRSMLPERIEERSRQRVLIGRDWVDVVRLGRGEPVVLVPGLAGSWKLLLPLARALARHVEVITYELHGDHVPWAGVEACRGPVRHIVAYADDLLCLIDQLGLESPTIFGVSFGGAIALELAAAHPHRLRSLVVNGAEARFRPTIGSTIARRVLQRFPLPSDNGFVNQFFHLLYGKKPDPGPLVDYVIDRIWETDQSVMAERLTKLESFDVSDRLGGVDVPSLVLAGGRDVIVPAARQRALAELIPGARFAVVEGAGHIGFLTHRAQVVRAVRRHLRRVGETMSSQG